MTANMQRLTLTITKEMEVSLDNIKKQEFYNRSYSDMMRTLLRLGITHTQNEPTPISEEYIDISRNIFQKPERV